MKYSIKKELKHQYIYDKFKCVSRNPLGQIEIIYHIKIGVLPQAFVTDITYSNGNIS